MQICPYLELLDRYARGLERGLQVVSATSTILFFLCAKKLLKFPHNHGLSALADRIMFGQSTEIKISMSRSPRHLQSSIVYGPSLTLRQSSENEHSIWNTLLYLLPRIGESLTLDWSHNYLKCTYIFCKPHCSGSNQPQVAAHIFLYYGWQCSWCMCTWDKSWTCSKNTSQVKQKYIQHALRNRQQSAIGEICVIMCYCAKKLR